MGWGGYLFEAGRLLTFSAFRMGAYSRWVLIQGWALIRIYGNSVKNSKRLCDDNGPLRLNIQMYQVHCE